MVNDLTPNQVIWVRFLVSLLILNTIKEPSSLIRENIGNEANDDGASPSWVLI